MLKATPQNSPVYLIKGKPKVYRGKLKNGRWRWMLGGSIIGAIVAGGPLAALFFFLFMILLFIMMGISFVLWLLPLIFMRDWAFGRNPRPPGALLFFYICLLFTFIPGLWGLDGLNKQDGWNWFHIYERTLGNLYPEIRLTNVQLGYGIIPAWAAWLVYRVWLWISDLRVVAAY